tara:strand:- start:5101 stop:5922 length:822 start_codon:yes stop_codon:yes gene_type:complete
MKKTKDEAQSNSHSNTQSVILFDMDGTLTPARGLIENFVVKKMRELSSYSRLGIVSGSDFEYIMHQCEALFDVGGVPVDKIDILPCNGTKFYEWNNSKYQLKHSVDMIEEIGITTYRKILEKLFEYQCQIPKFYPDAPLTGTFFEYRKSLLNWCPIGRAANQEQRDAWEKYDNDYSIRDSYVDELRKFIDTQAIPVTIALGGTTSFDIYPIGWNKTFALQYYPDHEAYFIGDRCEEGGNDYHIYEELKKHGRSWSTTDPSNTVLIIDEIVSKL